MDPVLLSVDSPMVITMVSDLSEFTGPPEQIPDIFAGPSSGGGPSEPVPDVFVALCHGFHPAGTPGAGPEGGTWSGVLQDDRFLASLDAQSHNDTFEPNPSPHDAFVAVRVGPTFIGPVLP